MSTLDSEYMSPTFRSAVDREMEMLYGAANHTTDTMLVPSVYLPWVIVYFIR